MFTRLLECTAKPGKLQEFTDLVGSELLSSLRRQHGFLDLLVLVSDTEPDHVLLLSLWKSSDTAEHFYREQFPAVIDKLEHLLKSGPMIRTFQVTMSTAHHLAVAA